jgi:glycosyltransferase involved in cell wall biosynthesis
LPSEDETRPWFDAVCALWDDEARYSEASARARAYATEHYRESVMRARYLEYFETLGPGGNLF